MGINVLNCAGRRLNTPYTLSLESVHDDDMEMCIILGTSLGVPLLSKATRGGGISSAEGVKRQNPPTRRDTIFFASLAEPLFTWNINYLAKPTSCITQTRLKY